MERPALVTERLWLRPLQTDDADDLHVAYADAECLRYWHHPPTASLDETREWVSRVAAHEDHWAFGVAGGDDTVLGYVGYVNGFEPGGHAGFGYLSRRDAWGHGYVPEAARAALAHGFDVVGIARAELWIERANARSIRAAEKLGARLRHEGGTLVYGLTAAEWRGDAVEPRPVAYAVEPILEVTDVAIAVRWWVEALGFRAGFSYGDPPTHAAVLGAPGWANHLRVQLTLRAEPSPSLVYVIVSDLDAVAVSAEAAGATVVTPLGVRPWGVRELELADPDGNRIRLSG